MRLQRDGPTPEDIEGVSRSAFTEDVLARIEVSRHRTARDRLEVFGLEVGEQACLDEKLFDRSHSHFGSSLIAAASSVMSIPTGHQAMQRPQPTQPELPNWSCQVPSLCVSQCR